MTNYFDYTFGNFQTSPKGFGPYQGPTSFTGPLAPIGGGQAPFSLEGGATQGATPVTPEIIQGTNPVIPAPGQEAIDIPPVGPQQPSGPQVESPGTQFPGQQASPGQEPGGGGQQFPGQQASPGQAGDTGGGGQESGGAGGAGGMGGMPIDIQALGPGTTQPIQGWVDEAIKAGTGWVQSAEGVATNAIRAGQTFGSVLFGGVTNWFVRGFLIFLGALLVIIGLIVLMWDHGGEQVAVKAAKAVAA
jgi:hypothetical protein